MNEFPPLNADNVQKILQMLLDEASKPMDEPYDSQWNKHRLGFIRQEIKVIDLWVQIEEYRAIQARLNRLDSFVSDIKTGMHSDEATEYIRSQIHGD